MTKDINFFNKNKLVMRFNNLGEKVSYIAHKFGKNNSIIIGNKKYSFSYLDKKSNIFANCAK